MKSCDFKDISAYKTSTFIPDLKKECPWFAEPPSQALQAISDRLWSAWQSCFSGKSKAPNFKKSFVNPVSIRVNQSARCVNSSHIQFPKLGKVRYVASRQRPVDSITKSVTLYRDAGHWYASIVVHLKEEKVTPRTNSPVGIDLGITSFLVDSDGNATQSPKFLNKTLKQLKRAQQSLSRKVKLSKNWKKQKKVVAKIHQKIRFQRKDFLHKLSTQYSKNHGIIVVEDLKIANMIKNKNLSRAISDQGWGTFVDMLAYKQEASGGKLLKVPAAYTSQTCYSCGCVHKDNRKTQASFACLQCGHTETSDINAAKNILALGNTL